MNACTRLSLTQCQPYEGLWIAHQLYIDGCLISSTVIDWLLTDCSLFLEPFSIHRSQPSKIVLLSHSSSPPSIVAISVLLYNIIKCRFPEWENTQGVSWDAYLCFCGRLKEEGSCYTILSASIEPPTRRGEYTV